MTNLHQDVHCRITVAICTWNRSRLLAHTLECFAGIAQSLSDPDWELLLIANACTDDTVDVAARFLSRLPLRIVEELKPGLSRARNRAIAESRTDWLLFTDDDVLVTAEWLVAFGTAIREYPHAAVFAGPVDPWFETPPDPELEKWFPAVRNGFCGVDHRLPLGPLPEELSLTGANFGVNLTKIGPSRFDAELGVRQGSLAGGEETDFTRAVRAKGGEVVWVPEMRLKHFVDPRRLELGYLTKLTRERGASIILEKGVPAGRRALGAPIRLWRQMFEAYLEAGWAYVLGQRMRGASRYAKAESYKAKISACQTLLRRGETSSGKHRKPR